MIYLVRDQGNKTWRTFEYIQAKCPEALMDYNRKLNVSDEAWDYGAEGPDLVGEWNR